jgi:hypothetical protein
MAPALSKVPDAEAMHILIISRDDTLNQREAPNFLANLSPIYGTLCEALQFAHSPRFPQTAAKLSVNLLSHR